MPGRGMPPRGDRAPLPADGYAGDSPELPPHPDSDMGVSWHPWTVRWYETIRRSPQAAAFLDTDWQFLAETAIVHQRFVSGDSRLSSELRIRMGKLGQTVEDRQRLNQTVGQTAAPDTQRDDRRRSRLFERMSA